VTKQFTIHQYKTGTRPSGDRPWHDHPPREVEVFCLPLSSPHLVCVCSSSAARRPWGPKKGEHEPNSVH
jgi:hypothetical protein